MLCFQASKDALFAPVVNRLLQLGISANLVSILSGLVAALSLFFALKFNTPLIFIVGICFHLLLDGLDGIIARFKSRKSSKIGLAMDLIFDSVGIVTIGLYILYFKYVGATAALLFIIEYLILNATSYIFAITNKEYAFVIRPRIFILAAILFDYIFLYSITPFFIIVSNITLTFFILIGIVKLFKP